jgi:N-succinyldiaminopimelate aminotransferase
VLPVNGSREALFAFAQCVVDPSRGEALVLSPNPFYQIYEGAALLAGAQPVFLNHLPENGFRSDFDAIPEATWRASSWSTSARPATPPARCSASTSGSACSSCPTARLRHRQRRVLFGDLFRRGRAAAGALQAAQAPRPRRLPRIVMFSSLSKRSNVPGLRSGFVAGDAALLKKFWLYRTYQGCAMSPPVQQASIAAWNDEAHVRENRRLYRREVRRRDAADRQLPRTTRPDAGFYLWARTPIADTEFARGLLREYNVTVLPGSYLARESGGINPGRASCASRWSPRSRNASRRRANRSLLQKL